MGKLALLAADRYTALKWACMLPSIGSRTQQCQYQYQHLCFTQLNQSCPWDGLGWVGNGSTIFIFGGLGWVMGLKWQICEKQVSCIHMKLCIVKQCFVNLSIMMSSENRTITYAGFEYLRISGNL